MKELLDEFNEILAGLVALQGGLQAYLDHGGAEPALAALLDRREASLAALASCKERLQAAKAGPQGALYQASIEEAYRAQAALIAREIKLLSRLEHRRAARGDLPPYGGGATAGPKLDLKG